MSIALTRDKMYEFITSKRLYQNKARDECINKLHKEGISVKQLSAICNLSKQAIYKILGKGVANS